MAFYIHTSLPHNSSPLRERSDPLAAAASLQVKLVPALDLKGEPRLPSGPSSALMAHRERLHSGPRLTPHIVTARPVLARSASTLSSPKSSPDNSPTRDSFEIEGGSSGSGYEYGTVFRNSNYASTFPGSEKGEEFVGGKLVYNSERRGSGGSGYSVASTSASGVSPKKSRFELEATEEGAEEVEIPALTYGGELFGQPATLSEEPEPQDKDDTATLEPPAGNLTARRPSLPLLTPPVLLSSQSRRSSARLAPVSPPISITTTPASSYMSPQAPAPAPLTRPPSYLSPSPRIGAKSLADVDVEVNYLPSKAIAARTVEVLLPPAPVGLDRPQLISRNDTSDLDASAEDTSSALDSVNESLGLFPSALKETSAPLDDPALVPSPSALTSPTPSALSNASSESPRPRFTNKFAGRKLDLGAILNHKLSHMHLRASSPDPADDDEDAPGALAADELECGQPSSADVTPTAEQPRMKHGRSFSLRHKRSSSRPGSSSGTGFFRSLSRPSSSAGISTGAEEKLPTEQLQPASQNDPKDHHSTVSPEESRQRLLDGQMQEKDRKTPRPRSAAGRSLKRPTSSGGDSIKSLNGNTANRLASRLLHGLRPGSSGGRKPPVLVTAADLVDDQDNSDQEEETPRPSPSLKATTSRNPMDAAFEIGMVVTPPLASPGQQAVLPRAALTPLVMPTKPRLGGSALSLCSVSMGSSPASSAGGSRPGTPPSPLDLPNGVVSIDEAAPWRLGEVEASWREAAAKAEERHRKRATIDGSVGRGWQPRKVSTPSSILSAASEARMLEASREARTTTRPVSWSPATFSAAMPLGATAPTSFSSEEAAEVICTEATRQPASRPSRPPKSKLRLVSMTQNVQTLLSKLEGPVPPSLREPLAQAGVRTTTPPPTPTRIGPILIAPTPRSPVRASFMIDPSGPPPPSSSMSSAAAAVAAATAVTSAASRRHSRIPSLDEVAIGKRHSFLRPEEPLTELEPYRTTPRPVGAAAPVTPCGALLETL